MNGVELAAMYAFPPNLRKYCGPPTFSGALLSGTGAARVAAELRKFPVHCAYLSLIAKANGKKQFDTAVVRAFWTGNRLLDKIPSHAMRSFMLRLLRKEPSRAEKLAKNMPPGIVPHHSFNPLYVNFVTGKVARSTRNYDACCVTSGEVASVSANSAIVRRFSIAGKAGGFFLKSRRDTVALERDGIRFIKKLKKGDIISVHWGMAIERLTPEQSATLKNYTQKNIDAINGCEMAAPTRLR